MTGQLIISLDCEGKWGMADRITVHHDRFLTRSNLINAYSRIVDLFAQQEIPATFAFVMSFVMTEDQQVEFRDLFRDVDYEGENWLRNFRYAEQQGNTDGWFCPEALDIVQSRPEHEIGCHGFCHVPLAEGCISREAANNEVSSALVVARRKGLSLKTFIFPRNLVGHLDVLADGGFVGYRARPPHQNGPLQRIANIASEFNVRAKAQSPMPPNHGMTTIPSGYFLNWQAGVRSLVPSAVTALRWQRILADAVEQNRIAHLFLHPHNIIDAPSTFSLLEEILKTAIRLRDQGRLDVITQAEYCIQSGKASN